MDNFSKLAKQLRYLVERNAPDPVIVSALGAASPRALALYNGYASEGKPGFAEFTSWGMVIRLYATTNPDCFYFAEDVLRGWGYGEGNWWMIAEDEACVLELLAEQVGEEDPGARPDPDGSKETPKLRTRQRKILELLSVNGLQMRPVEIAAEFGVDRTTISRDLKVLRRYDLVGGGPRQPVRISEGGQRLLSAPPLHARNLIPSNLHT